MNKNFNEYFGFWIEYIESFLALFNSWMNNQNISPRATIVTKVTKILGVKREKIKQLHTNFTKVPIIFSVFSIWSTQHTINQAYEEVLSNLEN